MKKRNVIGALLYPLSVILFVVSNSSVVSGNPIHLGYVPRVVLCGAAVCSIGAAPFLCKAKTKAGAVLRFAIAAAWICCIFAFGGFAKNSIA